MPRSYLCLAVLFFLLFSFTAVLTGCGGGSSIPGVMISGPYSNATLSGTYAFVFSGKDGAGFFGVAGNLQANGAGAITGGLMDINSGTGVSTNVPLLGTYTIFPNGQGTASLTSAARNFSLRFIVISPTHMRIASFDNNAGGHGDMEAFLPTPSFTLSGAFGLNLAGIDAVANPLLTLGAFNGDGAGNITAGVQDISDNGTISAKQAITGSFTLPVNGRGTLTFNTSLGVLHFAYYVSTPSHLKMVEIERGPALAGETFIGDAAPALAFLGCTGCVFAMSGLSSGQPHAEAGIFIQTGGVFSQVTEDINANGVASTFGTISGSFAVDPAFRGTLLMGTRNFAIYPSNDGMFMMQIDAGQMISGVALNQGQIGSPHLNLSFNGNYAYYSTGMPLVTGIDEVGQLTAATPPSGTVGGHIDRIANGVPSAGLTVTGSFVMDSNARGTATLQTSSGTQHIVLYATGGSGPLMFVGTDSNFVVAGTFDGQQ